MRGTRWLGVLSVALLVGLTHAPPAVAQAPDSDTIIGSGHVLLTDFVASVKAGPGGENPTGYLKLSGFVEGTATVACVNVSGNSAVAEFQFVDEPNVGRRFITEIVDAGPPTNGQPVDFTTFNGYMDQPSGCPGPGEAMQNGQVRLAGFQDVGAGPLTSGDVTIHDAPLRPPPGTDAVQGSARECLSTFPDQTCERRLVLDADAHSDPEGQHPGGAINWYDEGPTPGGSASIAATVTCLSVTGRVATIGLTGTRQTYGATWRQFPIAGLVRVTDAGGPKSGLDTIEFAIQMGARDDPPLPGPTSCSAFPGPFPTGSFHFPTFTNDQRDVVVTDTHPASTFAECRQGGWVKHGYSSHAECISAVHDVARRKCVFEMAFTGILPFRDKYGLGPNHEHAMRHCVRLYTGF